MIRTPTGLSQYEVVINIFGTEILKENVVILSFQKKSSNMSFMIWKICSNHI